MRDRKMLAAALILMFGGSMLFPDRPEGEEVH